LNTILFLIFLFKLTQNFYDIGSIHLSAAYIKMLLINGNWTLFCFLPEKSARCNIQEKK
jgi:hypothetical protein